MNETGNLEKDTVTKPKTGLDEFDGKKVVVAVILALLVLVSVLQAVQLAGLNEKINAEFEVLGELSLSGSGPATVAGNSEELKNNLSTLPSMVGGC